MRTAPRFGADAFIFDLEDSMPDEEKTRARRVEACGLLTSKTDVLIHSAQHKFALWGTLFCNDIVSEVWTLQMHQQAPRTSVRTGVVCGQQDES